MMTNLSSEEDYKECRNRNNPVKDVTQLYSKSGICDEYTVTPIKARKNKREELDELARINKEYEL